MFRACFFEGLGCFLNGVKVVVLREWGVVFHNSWSEFHFLHCCGSGNSRTCVHHCPFFFPKKRCKSFFTTCASVPMRDWTCRPSLTLDEICVFRKPRETRLEPVETRPEQGGIWRNWPDSDGTCHHQRAEQSPSARTRHRYLCFRPLTSETSIQQLAEVLSKKCVLGTRASRPAGLSFTPPDSTLLRVPPCIGRGWFRPVPPDSALWRSAKVVRLHVHPTSAHNKLRLLHMLRM